MYKLNYFNFRERKNNYLITNDMGKFAFVPKGEFTKLIKKENVNITKTIVNILITFLIIFANSIFLLFLGDKILNIFSFLIK